MQNINVDIIPSDTPPAINVSQGDIGRDFRIILEYDSEFVMPENPVITLAGTKPSGLGFTITGTLSEDEVLFTTTEEMTDEAGYISCEVKIKDGDNFVIGSTNCALIVEPNPHPDDITDGTAEHLIDEITALVIRAEIAASKIVDVQADATTLPPGSQATASYDEDSSILHFGIPAGVQGPKGPQGSKGDKGEIGPQGPQGETGAAGADGKDGVDGKDGANGKDGKDGKDGTDGYSPIAEVSKTGDTATISITDLEGTTTVEIYDGEDGQDGANGRDGANGQDGFSPSASVSKSGTTTTISITDKNGTTTSTVMDGVDGQDGQDGQDGTDGYSPAASVSKAGSVATITITDKTGTTTVQLTDGQDGQDGQDGHTPVKGTDYWTAQDQASIVNDVLAELIDAETVAM